MKPRIGRRRALAAIGALAIAGRVEGQPRRDVSVKVVGYLSRGAGKEGLARALAERGYVEGRNLRIEWRVASADVEASARELVQLKPDALVAWGAANVSALARQTSTIPIVCGGTADPVGLGYAKTLRRPGGHITGLSYGVPEMAEVLVGLMRAVRPEARRIATFVADSPGAVAGWTPVLQSVERSARKAGLSWEIVPVGSLGDFERSIGAMDAATSIAYLVRMPESVKNAEATAGLIRRRMASSTSTNQAAREGILMSYSIDHADEPRKVAEVVDALLRGANPAELPFQLPDRTTFVLNRKTARAIGLDLDAALLARATEIVD